jgi:Asp-tRNA(Asn)/Glu-tRNA(Gln) amidotransferase A subunit family amidase
MDLTLMGAAEAAEKIRNGRITSEELISACLEKINQIEDTVGAWAHLDPEFALNQARAADKMIREGRPLGQLHGVPVGIKDIIDTEGLPTENGTVLHAGRRPRYDATVVSNLRINGAVIIGKTVTTELAVYFPGKTRNPHNLKHTPGGSSSGSAAAVAAGMVPLAVGTQTNGSMIRPASFCGVFGYKPTFGLISRHHVLQQSRPLDQVGVFGRSIKDCAMLAESVTGYDVNDPDMKLQAKPELIKIQTEEPPLPPKLAFVKTPVWSQADAFTRSAFEELVVELGDTAAEVALPQMFDQAHEQHRIIMEADIARSFAGEYREGADRLSDTLKEIIERGQKVLAVDYNNAIAGKETLSGGFDDIFKCNEAIITPATIGVAPAGVESTGSPVFCTIWTLCGMPAITLPLMQGENGMPLGIQLVGPRGDDARLLRTARWLSKELTGKGSSTD